MISIIASLIILFSSVLASFTVLLYNYGYCIYRKTANRREILHFIAYCYTGYVVSLITAYGGLIITRQEPVPTFTVIALIVYIGSVCSTAGRYIRKYGECMPLPTLTLMAICYILALI